MKNSAFFFSAAGMVLICAFLFTGCTQGADETKPLAEVRAEAEQMDTASLRKKALEYKKSIEEKLKEIEKILEKIKEVSLEDLLNDSVKDLRKDVEKLTNSLNALKERFVIYFEKLKTLKGDITGLE